RICPFAVLASTRTSSRLLRGACPGSPRLAPHCAARLLAAYARRQEELGHSSETRLPQSPESPPSLLRSVVGNSARSALAVEASGAPSDQAGNCHQQASAACHQSAHAQGCAQ